MSFKVHDRLSLATPDNADVFRSAVVIAGSKVDDKISLYVDSMGIGLHVSITQEQALILGPLLVKAGTP